MWRSQAMYAWLPGATKQAIAFVNGSFGESQATTKILANSI
jgi:hypothetical protein